ncbi:MAG TPA: acyl-CoA dehydrogenase family protein [Baekduia sp.]|jgi:alkylation response protein AidB-like acyl-CoA dehydrogenase|nr:acyl-CoA dehydrogenase family protein [Baekduia sp.]
MTAADRSMGLGLRALTRIAGSDVVDRLGVRKPAERVLYRATRDGFRVAGRAGRTFAAGTRLGRPARPRPSSGAGLFDLTLDDEQQMLVEAWRDFASARLRPAAAAAERGEGATEIFAEANKLGLTMLGVPEELGGAISERSAVTAVLAAETLAHGDAGLTVGALAPAAVATALALWGDADQQATYLPALVSEDVPAAALAVAEPRALFDPRQLETVARRQAGGGYVLSGLKTLVPRAEEAELLIVAARVEGGGPALFLVEPAAGGVHVKADPAMGLRGAALGRVKLEDVAVGPGALLGAADPKVYAECIARSRLAWAAIAAGVGRAVLDYVIPYVNERIAFGEPVSYRQAVAFSVADIAVELEGLRLVTLRAAARADAEADFSREAALARSLAGQQAMQIGSEGVQLLGGAGYIAEHPVERWYRDLRATGLMEGVLVV